MAITSEQIVDSLLDVADNLFRALQVHDAETAGDYNEQIKEIREQYQIMTQ